VRPLDGEEGIQAMRGARKGLEPRGDAHSVLRGRGRDDQLASRWRGPDNVPPAGPGCTPVVADATSALALLPAYPAAVWRTRSQLSEVPRRWLWLLLVPSVLGGLVGALMLIWTDNRNFVFLVPWLVLGGTVLFTLEPRLSRRRDDSAHRHRGFTTALWPLAVVVTFVVALYGGYFGAGIGILMISALSLLGMGDVHRVVPLKNLLTGCLRGVAVLVLVIEGAVNWGYGLPMAFGGLVGGYLAGMVSGRVNRAVLRGVVIAIGFGLAAYYFLSLYGPPELRVGGE
jgi:uncharacterized protein